MLDAVLPVVYAMPDGLVRANMSIAQLSAQIEEQTVDTYLSSSSLHIWITETYQPTL